MALLVIAIIWIAITVFLVLFLGRTPKGRACPRSDRDLNPGDGRWDLAFRAACDKLYMVWLYDYYRSLTIRRRNRFDEIIEARLVCRLWPELSDPCFYDEDVYYHYLRGKYYAPYSAE